MKALFRRAKAHVGAWNPEEAAADFRRCAELDTKLKTTVSRELDALDELVKAHDEKNKEKYKNMFG